MTTDDHRSFRPPHKPARRSVRLVRPHLDLELVTYDDAERPHPPTQPILRHFLGTLVFLMSWPPLSSRQDASSCSTHICLRCSSGYPPHPSHRRRKHSSTPRSIPTPSSTLLSILASLVAASTADASPAPPSFLCPSLDSDDSTTPARCHTKRTEPLGTVANNDTVKQGGGRALRRLPDKYVEGDDGIWRRVESYTLYGVTGPNPSCTGGQCPPTQPISSIGIPVNGTAPTPPIEIQLPPGWNSPPATNSRTTMILAVSLALSLFICFLIICLFWRKGLLNKKRFYDVEAKQTRRNHTAEEHRTIEVEKETKALQKIWARASARWKANARYSLRQRRGKRLFTRSVHQSTASFANDSCSRLAIHTSRPPSILSSSIPSQNQEASAEERQGQNPTSCPSSPPAYRADHQIPPIIISPPDLTAGPISEYSAPSHLSRQPSQLSLYSSSTNPEMTDLVFFPTTAHLATDDKTLLARLADFASAPPSKSDTTSNMSPTQGSAPPELEVIVSPTSTQLVTSLFPPPPSKERLVAAERLEYAFTYENLESAEAEPEPSAPPFEENSTMAPLDVSALFPSAPPVIDDEGQDLSTCLPSAPSLEDVLNGEDVPEHCHEYTTQ